MEKYVWQYYWAHDYLGNRVKNIYHGPRLDWMKVFKERKNGKKKIRKISAGTK